MKNINYPLLLGALIVFLLVIISFFPQLFTSKDPLFEDGPNYIEYIENGELVEEFAHNPKRPNNENILGTDDAGRDLYARLIYGTRNTMKLIFLIAAFRMLIALPFGLAAGMGLKIASSIIRVFNTIFTAIPMLVFSYIIFSMSYFKYMEMEIAIIYYAIVLTIVGWSKLAGLIEDNVKRVMSEDFIEGEIAIGKTQFQIAYQNIIPHIIPSSISLFFKEMGMALFLLAQLAVLYVFVGVVREVRALAFRAAYEMILEPEWAGTLSRITFNIGKFESNYWLTLYPVLVISIGTIGLNLFGEGLRIEINKRDSRVISFIKKISYQLSARLLIEELKDIKKNYKPLAIKVLIIVVIGAYFIIPWYPSSYEFNMDMAMNHINELSHERYEERIGGSKGGFLAGDYIINTLESYGYETDIMEIPIDEIEGEPYPGRNIFAFLPGKDRSKEDPGPLIIIGVPYGRKHPHQLEYPDMEPSTLMTSTPSAASLEVARVLSTIEEPFEKSIQFVFWDNVSELEWGSDEFSGTGYFIHNEKKDLEMALSHGYYYIDMAFPGYTDYPVLEFMVLPSQRPDTDGQSYLIGLDMEKRFKQLGVKYKRYHYPHTATNALQVMNLNAITSLGIGSKYASQEFQGQDEFSLINYEKLENMGQILIDILTMEARIME